MNIEEQADKKGEKTPRKQKSNKNYSKMEEQTNKLSKAATEEKTSDKNDSNIEKQANKKDETTPRKQKGNKNDSNIEEQTNKLSKAAT